MSEASVVKREPALVHAAVLWLLANVGALVVRQEHWMGADEWSTLTTALVPLVTFLVAAVAGLLLRQVVSPAWSWLETHEPAVADAVEAVSRVDVGKVLAESEAIFPTIPPAASISVTSAVAG